MREAHSPRSIDLERAEVFGFVLGETVFDDAVHTGATRTAAKGRAQFVEVTGRATLDSTMVFVLDNYDSFTYNLVQYLGELGAEVEVYRNDELTVEQVEALKPERILLSPGPCTPGEAGILVPLIRHMAGKAPILGVCLGHQAIGEAFGGQVVRAQHLMHGKTSAVEHDGKGIFAGLPTPLTCTRYHSLIVAEEESLPAELAVTARTPENSLPVEGVQFG
jgi:anthranilate synthase/aminodeoxychorismate synthase-like glutamine amidotransferase